MVDELPDPEERREAEALAAALDDERTDSAEVEADVDAALLLRASAEHEALDDEGLARVWDAIAPAAASQRRAPRWLAPMSALAAAAAAFMVISVGGRMMMTSEAPAPMAEEATSTSAEEAAASPEPGATDLVGSQRAVLASADDENVARWMAATASHRAAFLADTSSRGSR